MRRPRNRKVRVLLGLPMNTERTQDETRGSEARRDCEPHADSFSEKRKMAKRSLHDDQEI